MSIHNSCVSFFIEEWGPLLIIWNTHQDLFQEARMKWVLLAALVFVASAAHGEIYRWADSRGTTHYTNSMDEIPVRYRARAKLLAYEAEKKVDTSTSLQNGEGKAAKPDGQPTVPQAGGTPMKQIAPVSSAGVTGEELRQRGRGREYRKSRESRVVPSMEE